MVPTCIDVYKRQDTKTHEKLNILDLKIAPKVALVDPQTLLKLPSRTMAACGIDALVHAVEAYTCKAACPHTDAYALYAIDIIQKNLRGAAASPDMENCTGMALGSTMAVSYTHLDVYKRQLMLCLQKMKMKCTYPLK